MSKNFRGLLKPLETSLPMPLSNVYDNIEVTCLILYIDLFATIFMLVKFISGFVTRSSTIRKILVVNNRCRQVALSTRSGDNEEGASTSAVFYNLVKVNIHY